jgi:putative SOS response-associated peptidase YedK
MCGRFRIARSKKELEESFDAEAFALDLEEDLEADALEQDPEASANAEPVARQNNASPQMDLFSQFDVTQPDEAQLDVTQYNEAQAASARRSPYGPRYNVAPGQGIFAVRQELSRPARQLSLLRWGLIPAWSNNANTSSLINARAESAAEKPAFREAMRLRRCLIPADGFYEWQRSGKQRLPYCFTLADNGLFAFAGLWERWLSPQGQPVESCAILTTAPNELVRELHDRMPAILPPQAYERWLDPAFNRTAELQSLLQPYPATSMRRFRVSPRVNHVQYDDPQCAAEIEAA